MPVGDTLDAIVEFVGRYVDIPAAHRDVVALWCMYTHCFPRQDFSVAPYLLVTSAERASGKSTLLDVSSRLVFNPLITASATPAYIGRTVKGHTLMLDELDMVYSRYSDESGKEMAAILNGGSHHMGAYTRLVPDKHGAFHPRRFSTFGPKMLVGIAAEYPDALVSRCVHIQMERKDISSPVERARDRLLTEQSGPIVERMTADAAALGALPFMSQMPDADGRVQDVWEPLLSLAGVAGQEWQVRALQAFHSLTEVIVDIPLQQKLLRDCRQVFDEFGFDVVRTLALIEGLVGLGEGWDTYAYGRPISPQALGRQLAKYGIAPAREAGTGRAIYYRQSFESAWRKYL